MSWLTLSGRALGTLCLAAGLSCVGWGQGAPAAANAPSKAMVEAGHDLFQQNCAFCHGRDAMGGETGPDLTRSRLVAHDVAGSRIGEVLRTGRPDKGMPPFSMSPEQVREIAAFVHAQAASRPNGGRRGVEPSDVLTGNAALGKAYFNGPGGCTSCHSVTGDLAGIGFRMQGLPLVERIMYPRGAKETADVTQANGVKVSGTVIARDEFHIALRDSAGNYHSYALPHVKVVLHDPAEAHVKLLARYSDNDLHNLVAYLSTLK